MSHPPLLYYLPGAQHLADPLSETLGAERGDMDIHKFPDGESYIRFLTDPADRHIALVACLDNPDPKLIPLIFAARTAHDLGAHSVGLVAPYMPYFRQDIAFHEGESVSVRHIGALLSACFSWVVTLDPHLHRLSGLGDAFSIPAALAHATRPIASWIRDTVKNPMLIGPDRESEQWVKAIADVCGAPYSVFHKTRLSDHDVEIEAPPGFDCRGHTPVIVDDIVSSGGTLTTLLSMLQEQGTAPPVCCIVHGLFSGDAYDRLMHAGASRIVTTNSIAHPSNAIDITPALAVAMPAQA